MPEFAPRFTSPTQALVPLLALLIVAGCGKSDRPTTIPVSGEITFGGAAPPAAGTVFFAPLEVADGLPRRPGSGKFDSGGSYDVTSFAEGDGLVPGKYRVRIECWKVVPTMETPGVSHVPEGFEAGELVVDAEQSGTLAADYDIPAAP